MGLRDAGRLDCLVAVSHHHDLGVFVAVIGPAAAKVTAELAIEDDVVLVAPPIRSELVVVDGVPNVVPSAQIARTRAKEATILGVGLGGEYLEIQGVRIAQPPSILELLALHGDFDRIVAARPGGFVTTSKGASLHAAIIDGILGLRRGVQCGVSIDKNIAEVLAVNGNDCFPLHVGGNVDLIRNGTLARSGVASIDDDVGVHLALPCVRGKIHEVDAEVETSIATREIASIAEGEGEDIARGIGVII